MISAPGFRGSHLALLLEAVAQFSHDGQQSKLWQQPEGLCVQHPCPSLTACLLAYLQSW